MRIKFRWEDLIDPQDPDFLFELTEQLGKGAFGTVYKGLFKPTGEEVAVKICQPLENEDIEDLMTEVALLKLCKSTHVVRLVGAYMKGDEIFMALEYCDGGSITSIFDYIEKPFSEIQIAAIMRETLIGLQYLHSENIVHRDLKGDNILLNNTGSLKLVDFGVSALCKESRPKTFIGTPYFMAPEVISCKLTSKPYSETVDIWSLAIVAIELADGKPPLRDIHPMKALLEIIKRPPPTLEHPKEWSAEFNDFLKTCLKKNPADRPSASKLLQHPFIRNIGDSRSILVDMLQNWRLVKEELVQEEEIWEEDEDEWWAEPKDAPKKPKIKTLREAIETVKQKKAAAILPNIAPPPPLAVLPQAAPPPPMKDEPPKMPSLPAAAAPPPLLPARSSDGLMGERRSLTPSRLPPNRDQTPTRLRDDGAPAPPLPNKPPPAPTYRRSARMSTPT
eukprot:CAMPEP_0177683942 /NCGR_PEP_ID=MMETSP0447-20121125/32127_1 /TAXON_ID=0 /ORGANISM="Stygamoeba regulata, Strain BSH-02190019" /LENGTH=447 /DNA_ID=CAMNT_0019193677 /DNA_START=204 /DNA_END=1543 /DNA_ORIENTATION=-